MRSQFGFQPDIEIEEINNIALRQPGKETSILVSRKKKSLEHPVSQVAQNPRHHEPCSQPEGENIKSTPPPEEGDQPKRDYGNEEKDKGRPCRIISHSESRPLIMHSDNRKEILDHNVILMRHVKPGSWRLKFKNHDPLRDLVQRIKGQNQ